MDFFDELPKKYRDYVNHCRGTASPKAMVDLWYQCLDIERQLGAQFGLEALATRRAIASIEAQFARQDAQENEMALRKDSAWGGGRPVGGQARS